MLLLYLFVFKLTTANNVIEKVDYVKILQDKFPGYGTEWIPMDMTDDGQFIIGQLTSIGSPKFDFSPDPNEVVTFTFYNRNNEKGHLVDIDSVSDFENYFDKTKPTTFITHGWMSSGTSNTCIKIKDGILHKYDQNVFILDWSDIAQNGLYPIPMSATKDIGKIFANFINKLLDIGLNPGDVHLIGHSLGAHICGFAGRGIKTGKVRRITGLDPALPGFSGVEIVERLNKNDADFVDVVHTCAGVLGISESIGDVDVYPNGGGMPQPGCENILEMFAACSHGFSWKMYYYSLITSKPMIAYKCENVYNPSPNECQQDGIPVGDLIPATARGSYYLKTGNNSNYVINHLVR